MCSAKVRYIFFCEHLEAYGTYFVISQWHQELETWRGFWNQGSPLHIYCHIQASMQQGQLTQRSWPVVLSHSHAGISFEFHHTYHPVLLRLRGSHSFKSQVSSFYRWYSLKVQMVPSRVQLQIWANHEKSYRQHTDGNHPSYHRWSSRELSRSAESADCR